MSPDISAKMKKLSSILEYWKIPLMVAIINGGVVAPMSCYGWLFSSIQATVNATAVQTGWIGSMSSAFSVMSGPIAVVVESHMGYRLTTVLGSTLCAVFMLLSSYVSSFIWLLLFYGVGYGIASCLTLHATLCTLFKYVDKSNRSRMTATIYSSISLMSMLLAVFYERIIPAFGWEFSLRVTSAYVFLLGVPLSCLLNPEGNKNKTMKMRSVSMQIDVASSMGIRPVDHSNAAGGDVERGTIPSISKEVAMEESKKEMYSSEHRGWLELIGDWRAWMILIAITVPGMALAAYWINTINYFESVGLSEPAILLNVTIITASEMVGRLALAFFGDKFPLKDVNLNILLNLVFVLVTSVLASLPPAPVLVFCCFLIGVGRGWSNVLLFGVSADLLKGYSPDQSITLTMIGIGLGFTLGALPTGMIVDATDSYAYAFIVNALFFLVGATIFVLLQVQRRYAKRSNERRVQHVARRAPKISEVEGEAYVNHAYKDG